MAKREERGKNSEGLEKLTPYPGHSSSLQHLLNCEDLVYRQRQRSTTGSDFNCD